MSFRRCLEYVVTVLLAILLTAAAPTPRSNIVLITVDDLGWADLSVQGSAYFETPHIDGLASQGMRFTNAYAAAAICSPSRAAIMTGRYPARLGITDWIRARFQGGRVENLEEYLSEPDKPLSTPPNPFRMELEEVTIAELLKPAGYTTAHIGKWHLGTDAFYPEHQGFDLNIGGSDYGQPPAYIDPYGRGFPTMEPRRTGEYLTDREADEAVRFIRQHRRGPFFLNMAHYAVHTPLQGREDLVARYKEKPKTNQKNATYAAMIRSVDMAVGRILATLDSLGIADRTIVIFTSDNGGLLGSTSNAPLRSGKGFPYEGGIRIPLMVRWPGKVPAATISYEPVSSIDLMPTLASAAGIQLPEKLSVDGRSLVEHLKSGAQTPLGRDALFWHFPHYREGRQVPPYSIVRSGPWKLIRWWEGPRFELYNLTDDIGEKTDLAAQMPEKVAEMDAKLTKWLTEVGARLPRPNPEYHASTR